jgi:hypothetical protein
MSEAVLGIAIAKRTGEMRILTLDEYWKLEEWSEARWEFRSLKRDPATGEPRPEDLEKYGFVVGGPRVIPGDMVEISPGLFRGVESSTNPSSP